MAVVSIEIPDEMIEFAIPSNKDEVEEELETIKFLKEVMK